ncbi:MAG: SDR family NAD(P)-dependent oxidoreductase [Asgard group archaeon]|nr:SDR family NAD(P)-dependent oxidoreductase [Asgard group archaeon]
MSTISKKFKEQFGMWGFIAGASEGLGAAFARVLAERGLNLILAARSKEKLQKITCELEKKNNILAYPLEIDLTQNNILPKIKKACEGKKVGLMIYNAALSPIGQFHEFSLEIHMQVISLNIIGPMKLIHYFGKQMIERGKGGILLMGSMAGLIGSPIHSHYGATKAYNIDLAQSLWFELKNSGIHVTTCIAGPIDTPNFQRSKPKKSFFQPPPMNPKKVARVGIAALQKNKPFIIPGFGNKISGWLLSKLLPRKMAIKIMGNIAKKMYGAEKKHINP